MFCPIYDLRSADRCALRGSETSPQLLDQLFEWGADLLVDQVIPKLLREEVTMDTAQVQDESLVEKAPMITKEEGKLWPHNETALQMRDKVRGFTGWPGTTLPVACSGSKAPLEGFRIKVADAEVVPVGEVQSLIGSDSPAEELFMFQMQSEDLQWVCGQQKIWRMSYYFDPFTFLARTMMFQPKPLRRDT
ncbi:unnamed protein product [Cladocopium goreaui]|uniref:Methionyl-tRNA formyltransferase n=1 Tax=Cladocopium goreaui TaxID=2562237 RepID=A0A9P1FVZ8_9DINO|nr:unnamed protein product [Cladocopium goreaui]